MAIYIKQKMEAVMTSFDFIKDSMSLSDEQMTGYENDLMFILNYVTTHQIKFKDHFELGFYSHMIGYIDRLRKKEILEEVDLSIKESIDKRAYDLTYCLVNNMAKRYDTEVLDSEVLLASIHIQTALSMEEM